MYSNLYYKFLSLVCIGIVLFVGNVTAEDVSEDAANTGFHLLEEPVDPYAIAMGYAGTALATKGFSYYNPALPFLVGRTYLSAEYGTHPKGDLKHTQLEAVIKLTRWFVGLSLHSETIEDIYETNYWGWLPFYNTPFTAQFTNISLTIGFSQWEDFAFAVNVNGMQDRIYDAYAYAFSFSAGAVYSPIPDKLSLGLSLLNLGTSTPMLGDDSGGDWGEGEELPFNSRLGIVWKDAFREMPYTVALDVVYRNVRDKSDAFTKHIKYRFSVPVGFEIRPLPPLAIRLGKRFNFPTEIINFGIGLNLDPLAVDASFVIPKLVDDAEIKWLTSITFFLKDRKKEPEEKPAPGKKPPAVSPKDTSADTSSQIMESIPDSGKQPPVKQVDTSETSGAVETSIPDDAKDSLNSILEVPPKEEVSDTVLTPADSVDNKESSIPPDRVPSPKSQSAEAEEITGTGEAQTEKMVRPPDEKGETSASADVKKDGVPSDSTHSE